MMRFKFLSLICLLFIPLTLVGQSSDWQPAENPLFTQWVDDIDPENPLPKYPRPQMVREHWQNLNGLWKFKMTRKGDDNGEYNNQILVPFPVESALSGIKKTVGAANRVWYKRTFQVDNPYEDGRVLLHFGASDWQTQVFINDQFVGLHEGGYDAFTFDITDYIEEGGDQTIEVTVWDPTDLGYQPVGKQTHDPRSIWYTAVTGIWQTVWLEYVPESYISRLKITPNIDNERVKIEVNAENIDPAYTIKAVVKDEGTEVGESTGAAANRLLVQIDDPKLWSPKNPFLYDLEVILLDEEGNEVDRVTSYFGMRKISVEEADDGYMRLFLNNEPLFQLGLLDQGWWPGGLYTPPTDEALKYDIKVTKNLGYNLIRKHVKVAPKRFYYWADKMGMLVWQDMPNGGMRSAPELKPSKDLAQQFKQEYKAMIDDLYNHPSIVMWVPFNEGWGQHHTREITKWTKNYDPTRLVDNASGWYDKGVGDVIDMHKYPGPGMHPAEDNRASILGEFGGQALVVEGHLWIQDFSRAPGHYETSTSKEKLHDTYDSLIEELMELKDNGLAAAIYTQTTDVESEVNGIMTYDRKVVKFDPEHMREIHRELIEN